MRVLFVLSELDTGGAAVVHRLLADRLTAAGVDVDIFSYKSDGWKNIFASYPREQIIFQSDMTLTELLCRRDYDVVHAASDTPDRGLGRSLALSRSKTAVVLTCHGHELPKSGINCADILVAVSNSMAETLGDRVSLPLRVIHNGIDERIFHPNSCDKRQRPIVLWVGRPYDVRKDFIGLVALSGELQYENVDILAVLACPDDYPITLGDWLGDRIKVIQNLSQQEMCKVYRETAASGGCVVSTSLSEGLPMSIMESLACGCPVVAPSVGGISEILNSSNGCLYDRSIGATGLKNIIIGLINSPLRNAIVSEGQKTISNGLTATQMAENYHRLYLELIKKNRGRKSAIYDKPARLIMGAICRAKRR